MATTENPKQFLDRAGLSALWDKIYKGFAPRWQSYKPSNEYSTADDRTPADFVYAKEDRRDGILVSDVLNIPFVSAGPIKDAEGNKYGKDLIVQINTAVPDTDGITHDGTPGLLSSHDKWKIDNMGTTAESAVTLKGIKVNNDALTIDGSKLVNWDLQYDDTTNQLQIMDLNANGGPKVMTSVNVNDILSDAVTKGFLISAQLTLDKPNTEEVGPFLELVFATIGSNGTTTTDTVYISVKDLVDIYTAGTGITITNGPIDVDGQPRTGTISLNSALTDTIGGIKVTKVDTSKDFKANDVKVGRDFQLQKDKNDYGFVTVPIDSFDITDVGDNVKATTISPVTGGSMQLFKEYDRTAYTDGDGNEGHKLTPSYVTLTVSKESDVTVTGKDSITAVDGGNVEDGTKIKVVTNLTAGGTNGHTLTPEYTEFTLKETELSLNSEVGEDDVISAKRTSQLDGEFADRGVGYVSTYEFTTSDVTSVNDHAIQITQTKHSFDVSVYPISDDFIEALEYRLA